MSNDIQAMTDSELLALASKLQNEIAALNAKQMAIKIA